MNALQFALDAAAAAEKEYMARCLVVWRELRAAEPQMAAEILALGFDEATAAQWVCSPLRELGESPAALIAAGQTTEIMGRIYRTAQGFVG